MELELRRAEQSGYEVTCETTLFSEDTQECIVPDYCPDILRIVDCDGVICLRSKETTDGRVEVRGTVQVTVLYLPEEAEEMRHMEVSVPYSCSADLTGVTRNSIVYTTPRIVGVDARLLNPRKIYVRTEIALDTVFYDPHTYLVSMGCEGESSLGIEEKREMHSNYFISALQEKSFTYADELSLPVSKSDMVELLHRRIELLCGEYKLIGNKVVIKGQAVLKLLYRGSDRMITCASFELPFSQIMEVSQECEEDDCALSLFLADFHCEAVEGDARRVSVSFGIQAQAVLRRACPIEILTDLYSTAYTLETEHEQMRISNLFEKGSRRVAVREILESPVAVKSVVDCRLDVGSVRPKADGHTMCFLAQGKATILYLGEDDGVYAMSRLLETECRVDGEHNGAYTCTCCCPGELYATPTTAGIELRFPLDFEYRAETGQNVTQVSGVRLNESEPVDSSARPSVILRLAGEGEGLWELAKSCAAKRSDILQVNGLTGEEVLAGRLLLIPKRR